MGGRLTKIAIAAAFGMGLSASADATVLYTNGPIDGINDAWTINLGFQVADSFSLASPSTLTSVDLGIWNLSGDTTTQLDWAILSDRPDLGPIVYASGTASVSGVFQFTNA